MMYECAYALYVYTNRLIIEAMYSVFMLISEDATLPARRIKQAHEI